MLLKEPWDVDSDTLPNIVPPHGLSIERQWYLYEQIRPFCPDEDKDTVCPLPLSPKPGGSRRGTPHPEAPTPSHPDGEMPAATPQPKRRRLCGVCHEAGHNKRSCPNKHHPST